MPSCVTPGDVKWLSILRKEMTMSKKIFISAVTVMGVSVLLLGCQTKQNYAHAVHSWEGHHASALAHNWGQPAEVIKQKGGKQQWVYYQRSRDIMPTLTATPPHVSRVRTVSGNMGLAHQHPVTTTVSRHDAPFTCTTKFDVNRSGLITGVQYNGAHCVANRYHRQQKSAYVGG